MSNVERRARLRSVTTALMIGVASIATLATSRTEPELGGAVEGPAIILDTQHPEGSARFVLEANAAALVEAEGPSFSLRHNVLWSGLPHGESPEISMEVVRVDGPDDDPEPLERASCWGMECLGTYEVTFRWPDALRKGNAIVRWEVSWRIGYEGQVPAGAEATLRMEPPAPAVASPRFHEEEVTFDLAHSVSAETIHIETGRAISPNDSLLFELDAFPKAPVDAFAPFVDVALLFDDHVLEIARSGTATAVPIPTRCQRQPCSFSFGLVGRLRPTDTHRGPTFTWGLSSSNPIDEFTVVTSPMVLPALMTHVSLGPMHLVQDKVLEADVTVRVMGAALPLAEFGTAPPLIQMRLDPNPSGTLVVSESGSIDVDVSFDEDGGEPAQGLRPVWWAGTSDLEFQSYHLATNEGERFVLPGRCVVQQECEIEIHLRFTGRDFRGEELAVDFEPTLEAMIAYPLVGEVPEGADIDLVVGGSQ